MFESENVLLRRFAATGDPEAFSEIVRRHAGLAYSASLRVLEDKDRAADAVQETFLQLLRNTKTITGSVPSWLHRVATRKAIDVIRRDSSRRRREAKYAVDKPKEVVNWRDLSQHVDEELDQLDEQTRNILIQYFLEGKAANDIAAEEEISQSTISRRIESGVARLRANLRKRGIIVGAAGLIAMLGENAVQAAPQVVLRELGKIALVGGEAAAATGAATAATTSAGGARAATGILAGVKAKAVTAAAVTVVGVSSVVTYNHVTKPSQPAQPAGQAAARQVSNPSPRERFASAQMRRVPKRPQAAGQFDMTEADMAMWEQIFAEANSSPGKANAGEQVRDRPEEQGYTGIAESEPVQGEIIEVEATEGATGGMMGFGGMGDYGPGASGPEDIERMRRQEPVENRP